MDVVCRVGGANGFAEDGALPTHSWLLEMCCRSQRLITRQVALIVKGGGPRIDAFVSSCWAFLGLTKTGARIV